MRPNDDAEGFNFVCVASMPRVLTLIVFLTHIFVPQDASCLNHLLNKHGDDAWDDVRPAFSEERVKEGQSLTDLAYYLFPFDTKQQLRFLIEGAIRTAIWKRFPTLIYPDPQVLIGCGYKLSEVYNAAKSIGIIDAAHATNDKARREYWEKRWGMTQEVRSKGGISAKILLSAILCAGFAMSMYVYHQMTPPAILS